jgi:protein-disulfide isomerase
VALSGHGFEVTASDRTLGDPKAKLVLIEYAAPICPHCARFSANVFPQVKKNYIDTGKVLYVFRVFPLAAADGAAEKLARCVPRGRYFGVIDLLFRNQPQWDPEYGETTPALQTPDGVHAGLLKIAAMAGLSAGDADKCMNSSADDERINKVGMEAQARYNINSTPSFVLDGALLQPPYMAEWSYADIAKALDGALTGKN